MRRIIAMLMAIVLVLGNVPVQAFATEAEILETVACITEGCTYGAGHTGECSTFVACGENGCIYSAGHASNCSSYVEPDEPKAEAAADATIYITVSNRGELGMAYEEVTVSDINQDGKLSVEEALYAAHAVHGKGYASENGIVTKLWDEETTNVSFFLNHVPVSADAGAGTLHSGDYLVASVDRDLANDYDKYSRFDVLKKSVSAGSEFVLTLTDDVGNVLAGMEIGLWNGNGSTTMTGLTTDVNGSVALTLDQEGMYCITAKGTLLESSIDVNTMEITSIETPILAPVCVVTVSGKAVAEAGTTEGNVSKHAAHTKDRSVMNVQSGHSVTVGFAVVDCLEHNVERMRKELTVTPGLAKQYFPECDYGGSIGMATEVGENDVSPIDVLVAAHLDAFGETFAANPDNYIEGFDYAIKMFGESSEITWTANGIMPYTEGEYGATGYAINQYIVQSGDEICFYRMSYSACPANVYASFHQVEAEAKTGEELRLRLGYCATMEYYDSTFPAANIEVFNLNEDGTLGISTGLTTDENGEVTLTFENAGTYYLTCRGEVEYADMMGNSTSALSPAYIKINVKNAPVAVESVTLDKSEATLDIGGTVTLTATVNPDNATNKTVTWTSDNVAVATVTDGVITAVGAGTAAITATAGNVSAACQVTVSPPAAETGGIIIETGHVAEFMTDRYVSQIVLQGVSGKASGSGYSWEVVLDENTPLDQEITFQITSSVFAPPVKAQSYFWVNDTVSEKSAADADPGTITIQPEWNNGQARVTVGIGTSKKMITSYVLELSIEGLAKEDLNTIKLEENKSKKYFAKSFTISDAVVSEVTVSDTDYSGSTSGHKATIDVTLAEMPAGNFNLTMHMTTTGSAYVAVNGGNREALDGSYTTSIDLNEGTVYELVTYSSAGSNTARGTYTFRFAVEGVDLNAAPVLKDSSKTEEIATRLAGQTYTLDLASLFVDANGDTLTYTVQVDDAEPVAADADYTFHAKEEGKYVLTFRANDGKATSEDAYCVYLTVEANTAPYLTGENSGTAQVDQYSAWTVDLGEIFADSENNGITYTVRVNGGDPASASRNYSYIPETVGQVVLEFRAKDDTGAQSDTYTMTLTVNAAFRTAIDTSCTESENGDTWVGSITVTGAEVIRWKWNVDTGHEENQQHVLHVELSKDTPADALIQLAYTPGYRNSAFAGSISGPASVQLTDGKAAATVTTRGWMGNGTARTYVLNFTNQTNSAPVANPDSAEVSLTTGDELKLDLSSVFSDPEGDALRYTLTQGEQETEVEAAFSTVISTSGTHVLVFTAYDVWDAKASHTVTVTASLSEKTYDVSFRIPEGIVPGFYVTGSFDGENGDTLGDALSFTAGETADGFTAYTVAVPETVSRISFRGSDAQGNAWGGMTAEVSAEMDPVVVIQLTAAIPSKVSGSYVTNQQALFQMVDKDGNYAVSGGTGTDDYGIVHYRFLVVAWGTDDLAKAYTAYVVPQGNLTSGYATSVGANKTFVKDQPQQITTMTLTPKSSFTITAPAGATVQMFQQKIYYNSPEIPVTSKLENDDGTVDWVFSKGSSMNMSYRVSMPGKITKVGYVSGNGLTVTWDETDASADCRIPYNTGTVYGARGDDSLMLNVNKRNHLVLNPGDTFRLRAYRIWEVINSDTANVMIQPDMSYSLSGDNIVSITPVTTGNGNGKNNWLDLTAGSSGVAYLEVRYDAMKLLTGNVSGFGGDEIGGFVFNASDPSRTGLVVVQVGNAAADVDFGIHCSSRVNGNTAAWDAEFDTLYFTGGSGKLTFRPTVASGSISQVAVSPDKGANWNVLTAADGVYTADIVSGNNIIRITKSDGTQAYQVVRGDKITVSITGGDGDDIVEAGERYRIQLHGLHNPIGKMAGNYNPGYQAGQHVTYQFNGSTVTTSVNYQYDFVSNAWVDVTIPENARDGEVCQLSNGMISFNMMGIAEVDDDSQNHRCLTDEGCTTRASGGSSHQRSILPEIALTVGCYTDGSAAVEELTLEPETITLTVGDTAELKATVKPADTEITWSSSDVSVAAVSEGIVTANKAGTAMITAKAGKAEAACTVTVEPGLIFDIAEEDIVGYVTVSFEDNGIRKSSELSSVDQKFKQPLGTIVETTRVPFKAYDTVAAVTLRLLDALNMTVSHSGNADSGFYLSSIGNFTVGETTYESFGEFDAGGGSGWMVTQNDVFINKGASEFHVKSGDEIRWQYTCQLGADIGDTFSKAAVEAVEKLINDIGNVTLDSEDAIQAAREAYDKLAPVQQAAVSNYDVLTAAEAALAALKAGEADRAAANVVINLIEAIGEGITEDSREAIEAARAAYDALTEDQKKLVTNYGELTDAEEYLELLTRVDADIADIYRTTGDYLASKTLSTGTTNGEWAALGLARSGRTLPESYYDTVAAAVKNNRLHEVKSTENSRVILALTAIGRDVTDVNGYNLLAGLNEMSYITRQGINGAIYALIALDAHGYTPVGVTREALLEKILTAQLDDGGWSLGDISEVDLTAMAIQALAPYYSDNQAAVDKALTWLSDAQNRDGSFSTGDGANAESIAQVIVALTALGIDPDEDSRFIKTGITPVQALAQFYVEGGGFEHIKDTGKDDMATEQGYYALAAYARFKAGQTSLYDMSDVTIETSAANQAAADAVIALINAIGIVDLSKEDEIAAARAAYDALTDAQKALVTNYQTLTNAERKLAQLQGTPEDQEAAGAVKTLIDQIGTVDLTKEDEINRARSAYNALTTLQKNLVGADYLKKLTDAETALAALKKAAADETAAAAVEEKIRAIGTNITLGSETKIKEARNAYDALTEDQKKLVSNYQALVNAEAALNLLKSTVSVTFSLLGCYKHGTGETTVHTLAGGNLQTWIAAKTYKVQPGATVKDLFEQALRAAGLTWSNPTGNYVESITRNGVTIGEFSNGTYSGWMYTLNGKHPGLGVRQQTLVNGDKVVFHYSDDYRKEEGRNGSSGSSTGSSTAGGSTNYITTTTTTVNTETAESVDRLIEDIGEEITLDSEAKILAARAAYDALTEEQKKLVNNYDLLVEAEAKLARLKGSSLQNVYEETGDYLQGLGTPGVGNVGGEWMVIGLARSGRPVPTGYYDHVINYVRENINDKQQLHSAKSSDNSRLIMALTAIGKDVTDVVGHDLLMGLSDMDYIRKQGINGPIWALMAFDSGNYPVPEGNVSRKKLIHVILEAQLDDGGWALSGDQSDPDMTGMAVQALAPYMESDLEVKKAVEAAIWTLSKMQNDNGSFSSVDGANSESIAQVIVALAALGIDADTDARFVKNGISVMRALMNYSIPGGGFRHILEGNLDGMSTEQAYYALVAYNRMKQNQNFLYDMTDVVDAGGDVIVEETTEPTETPTEPAVEEEEDNGNNVVIWTGVMSICAAAIAVLLLNRKKLFGKF